MTLDILKKDQSPYQKSFLKQYDHSDRYAIEDIEGWTNAHKQIHSRSDWSMGITQGFEAWLAKTVVNFMIKALDGVPEEVTKHPMGVEVKAGIWVLAVSARQRCHSFEAQLVKTVVNDVIKDIGQSAIRSCQAATGNEQCEECSHSEIKSEFNERGLCTINVMVAFYAACFVFNV
ncbi:hypothetical protein SUGI_0691540 [Cryptomeria japonica]|nr:hypothetical protein SUGI_0691540 [Cryptomeria japonica]